MKPTTMYFIPLCKAMFFPAFFFLFRKIYAKVWLSRKKYHSFTLLQNLLRRNSLNICILVTYIPSVIVAFLSLIILTSDYMELFFEPKQIYRRGNLMQFCFQKCIFYQRQNILTSLHCFVDVVVFEQDSFKLP